MDSRTGIEGENGTPLHPLNWRSSQSSTQMSHVGFVLRRSSLNYTTDDGDDEAEDEEESWKQDKQKPQNPRDQRKWVEETNFENPAQNVISPDKFIVDSKGKDTMTSLERLIRTHPIWFLPIVQERSEVNELLRGKEKGNFIIRHSSDNTLENLALSIQTSNCGYSTNSILHFIIQQDKARKHGKANLRLECSKKAFDNVLSLVYHYCNDSSELPVELCLPQTLRESNSRQNLTSVSLLAKDFWRYPMSFPSCERSPSATKDDDLFRKRPNSYSNLATCVSNSEQNTKNFTRETESNRRSFVDQLLPSHQQALLEHQTSLMFAQRKLLDARFPPKTAPKPPTNALDDTLVDLQEVSNLLEESLMQLKTEEKSSRPPQPPSRTFNSAKNSPATKPKRRKNSYPVKSALNESVSPLARRKLSSPAHFHYSANKSAYFKSAIADKMSDYEDIWENGNISRKKSENEDEDEDEDREKRRSLTPAESEVQFMAYLEQKFFDKNDPKTHVKDEDSLKLPVISDSPSRRRKKTVIGFQGELTSNSSTKECSHKLPDIALQASSQRIKFPNSFSTNSSFSTSSSSSSNTGQMEVSAIYSDPLDALEKAEDTRIYHCPEFGEIDDELVSENPKRLSDINMNLETKFEAKVFSVSSQDLRMKMDDDNSCPLKRVRKNSRKNEVVNDAKKRENRLSAVIGKYIRPPRGSGQGRPCSWQVDSSSWEFLGQEEEDENELNSTSNPTSEETSPNSTMSTEKENSNISLNSKTISDKDSCQDKIGEEIVNESDVVGLPSLNKTTLSSSGERLQAYLFSLSSDNKTLFSQSLTQFVTCTEESREKDPSVVMRNMRQFISGMKNYLIRHGEKELLNIIEEERRKLRSDEFLQVDSILESTLHTLITHPLREHLDRLFSQDFQRSGCLQLLSANMKHAKRVSQNQQVFPIPDHFKSHLKPTVDKCKNVFSELRESYSPVVKLEAFLSAIKIIINSSSSSKQSLTVDEFCSLLALILVEIDCQWIEMESEFMWGLLHPSLLAGEGGYYLTMLSSTIHFIKTLDIEEEKPSTTSSSILSTLTSTGSRTGTTSTEKSTGIQCGPTGSKLSTGNRSQVSVSSSTTSSIRRTHSGNCAVKVLIPQDVSGSIVKKSFPIKPGMTVKELARMIAHKMKVTNAEDFALHSLVEGKEFLLMESHQPHLIRQELLQSSSSDAIYFVYKRRDTTILWPKEFINS